MCILLLCLPGKDFANGTGDAQESQGIFFSQSLPPCVHLSATSSEKGHVLAAFLGQK